jgi:endonuclease/exonuclease/phosphatase family metal-dependent hydrolase
MNSLCNMTASSDLTTFQRSLALDRVYVKDGLPKQCDDHRLRILSWNIGRGHAPERLAETLVKIRPDLACLQEVDWGNGRTGSRDVLASLAQATEMLGLFGIEFLEVPSPYRRASLAGGGATGNALLTRLDPVATFRVELPPCLDWERWGDAHSLPRSIRRCLRNEKRIGQRFGLGAEFLVGGHRLRVCSLHLEDKQGGIAGRWAQFMAAAQAVDACSGERAVSVIAGDFNTFDCRLARFFTPDSDLTALGKPPGMTEAAWWKRVLLPRTGFSDPFPDDSWTLAVPPLFRAKLDWITTKGCEVRNFGVCSFSSSDHRPIWVDLRMTEL